MFAFVLFISVNPVCLMRFWQETSAGTRLSVDQSRFTALINRCHEAHLIDVRLDHFWLVLMSLFHDLLFMFLCSAMFEQ